VIGSIDGVELKMTVPDGQERAVAQALGLDPLDPQISQVYFLDTPDLALSERVPRRHATEPIDRETLHVLGPVNVHNAVRRGLTADASRCRALLRSRCTAKRCSAALYAHE
jgi:hypothetical protein